MADAEDVAWDGEDVTVLWPLWIYIYTPSHPCFPNYITSLPKPSVFRDQKQQLLNHITVAQKPTLTLPSYVVAVDGIGFELCVDREGGEIWLWKPPHRARERI